MIKIIGKGSYGDVA